MSDVENTTEIIEPVKPEKKQMSDAKKAQLANARIKAVEKKALLKSIADKEKEIKNNILQDRIKKVEAYENLKKGKKKPKIVESSSSESESESSESESSESEEDFVAQQVQAKPKYNRSKQVSKPRREARQHETHELTAQIARDLLKQRIDKENFNVAFNSLFPSYRLL
jgi:hypothetical protein